MGIFKKVLFDKINIKTRTVPVFIWLDKSSHYKYCFVGVQFIGFVLLLFSVTNVSAATKTWDGIVDGGGDTGSNNWTTGENWTGDTAPALNDDVIFNGTSTKTCIIDAAPPTLTSITVNSGYTGSITQNASVTATNLSINTSITWSITNSSNLAVSGSISNSGTIVADSGTATLSGTATKTVGGTGSTTFYNLTISNGAGDASYQLSGNITVSNNLTIAATDTLDLSTKNLSLGGNLANSGTLTATGGTTTMTGTSKTFGGAGTTTAYNLTINGSNSALAGNTTVSGDLTVNSGKSLDLVTYNLNLAGTLSNSGTISVTSGTTTLTGTSKTFGGTGTTAVSDLAITGSIQISGSITVKGDLTGAGSITGGTSSTVTLTKAAAGALSATTKTFYNLIIDGAYTLTGNMTVTNVLTINLTKSFALGANTVTLSGSGTPLVANGTFTQNTSKVTYTSSTGATVGTVNITYYNLEINSSGQTFLLAGNVTVSNDLTILAGTLNAETKNLAVSGNITATSPGTLTASGGTTTVDGLTKTLGGSGTTTFYNLTITNGVNATYTLNGNITVSGDLTITASDSLDLSTKNLSLAGSFANSGTITASAGSTTTLTGTTKTFGGGTTTVYNLTVSGTYTLAGNTTVNGDLTIDSSKSLGLSTYNLPLAGSLSNSGTLTASAASTATLSGASKTFGGIGSTTFYNLAVTGSYQVTGSVTVSNDLTGAGTITSATNSTLTLGTTGTALSITTKTFYNLIIDGAYTLTGNMTVTSVLTINTGRSLALGANTLTLSGTGDLIQGTGTLTINTSTIKYTNAAGATLENLSYYNLETVSGTFLLSANLIVTNDLTITSGTLNIGTYNLTLSGTLSNSGTLSSSSGSTATVDGATKTLGGSGSTTFYNLTINNGAGAASYTLSGNVTVNGVLTIAATDTLDLSNKTVTLTGSGTPLVATGTFTQSTSTVLYTSTSGATVATTNVTYYNLTISSSGQTFSPDGNLTCTGDLTVTSGTISLGTRNLTVSGNISNSGSLTATAPSTTTISGAAKTLGGSGTTSLYTVTVAGTGSYTATGDITVNNTITIALGGSLDLSNKTLTLTASGTPLVATGTFTASTSTVKYTSTTGATVATTNVTYYKLEINSSGQTFTVGAALTCNNDLVVTAGTLSTGSNMAIGGNVSNSDILTATAGTATLSGASKTVGGTGSTTLNNVTVSGSYQINNSITVSGDLAGAGTISPAANSLVTLTKAAAGALSATTKTFYNLTIDGAYTLTNNMTVTNVLTINTGKSLDIQTYTLTLSGTGTPLVINGTGALNTTGATSTVAYTTTSSANVAALSTYDNLTINGTGGTFIAAGNITCGANLTVTAGTFSLSNNDSTVTGNISVVGTLTATGGTTTVNGIAGTETIGGGGSTTFYNLTINNGAGAASYTLSGNVTVNGVLTIAATDTLNLADKILNFGGSGDVLQGTGTLTIGTSTIGYTGSSGATIENLAYNNLTIAGGGTFLPSANLAVAKDLTITSGTLNLSTYNLSVAESLLNTGGVVTATNSSTTTLTGAGENLGGNGSTTFYNLVIGDGAGDSYTLSGNVTTLNNTTVSTGAQLDLGDKNISVSGNISNLGTIVSSGSSGTLTLAGTGTVSGGGPITVDNLTVTGTYTMHQDITIDKNLTNGSGSAFNHNSKNITVSGTKSSSNHFEIITLHNQKEIENIRFSVTVTLKNQSNATVTGYNGAHNVTWTWTATASAIGVAPTIHPDGVITFTNGTATIGGFILTDVDEQPTISLTDDNNTTGTSAKVKVLAGKFVDNNTGATIERPDKTKVIIPPGALKSPNALIVINIPDSTSVPSFGKGYKKRLLDTPVSREMGIFEGDEIKTAYFSSAVTITLPYTTSAIGHTPEDKLKIYTYNTSTNLWDLVDGTHTVDTITKTITVNVTHFSFFTIMGTWLSNDLANVKVYPNPCKITAAFDNKVKFVNLTKDVAIKIYTVEGELVRSLSEIDFGNDGWITWDGQNEEREDVARGIYLYIATNESGGKATGKIAIIR